jgi:hypothetical protein
VCAGEVASENKEWVYKAGNVVNWHD